MFSGGSALARRLGGARLRSVVSAAKLAPRRLQSSSSSVAALSVDNINQKVVDAEYAVRGAIVLRALEHEKALSA